MPREDGAQGKRGGRWLLDALLQNAHFAGAAFLFYEDWLLGSCGIVGLLGVLAACLALEAWRISPTCSDNFWDIVVPVCSALAVVSALGARWWHVAALRSLHLCVFSANCLVTVGVTIGDRDSAWGTDEDMADPR
mmetsp:Transcript_131360/g.380014  ORF Transcript_131360/g.380014 Transcript_131360/m.380014 type:complete len:135 (+) Transcript_131360:56-460(+)